MGKVQYFSLPYKQLHDVTIINQQQSNSVSELYVSSSWSLHHNSFTATSNHTYALTWLLSLWARLAPSTCNTEPLTAEEKAEARRAARHPSVLSASLPPVRIRLTGSEGWAVCRWRWRCMRLRLQNSSRWLWKCCSSALRWPEKASREASCVGCNSSRLWRDDHGNLW